MISRNDLLVRYDYNDAQPAHTHAYLWPVIQRAIRCRAWPERRAFDLGCGNGATGRALIDEGFEVFGVDPSESGVRQARSQGVKAEVGSAYDDLSRFGVFPLVLSLEVIAHCHDPRAFMRGFLSLMAPGGICILSTPYHGYLKNLLLAASGRMDAHFNALWPGGPLKFYSIASLSLLLRECGAPSFEIERVGRVPALAKSMVAVMGAGA